MLGIGQLEQRMGGVAARYSRDGSMGSVAEPLLPHVPWTRADSLVSPVELMHALKRWSKLCQRPAVLRFIRSAVTAVFADGSTWDDSCDDPPAAFGSLVCLRVVHGAETVGRVYRVARSSR